MAESQELSSRLDQSAKALTDGLLKVVDNGIGPLTGGREYAEHRLRHAEGDVESAIRRIVRETITTTGTAGFVTGVGGFATMALTLPANIAGQAILNARMVAAIAHLRGWDLQDEFVRNAVLITVAGGHPNQVFKQFAVNVSSKVATNAVRKVPIAVIHEINRRAGFMLVAKYGTKRSAVTLVKAVPAVGGLVGGGVDASFTKVVSVGAKRGFPAYGGQGGQFAIVIDE